MHYGISAGGILRDNCLEFLAFFVCSFNNISYRHDSLLEIEIVMTDYIRFLHIDKALEQGVVTPLPKSPKKDEYPMPWWEHCIIWGGVVLNLGSAWVNYRSIRCLRAVDARYHARPRDGPRRLEGRQQRERPFLVPVWPQAEQLPLFDVDTPPNPWRRRDEL